MAAPAARTRVLCLGNDILADDAIGLAVHEALLDRLPASVELTTTGVAGLDLLDFATDVDRLVVVDAIQAGRGAPGTVHLLDESDLQAAPGDSPHYTGLLEALALGRQLGLPVAGSVYLVAIEIADAVTVGGPIHPEVRRALPRAVSLVEALSGGVR